jgi:GntR family transcriptional repressor for pyruvate dehydrogenase complex
LAADLGEQVVPVGAATDDGEEVAVGRGVGLADEVPGAAVGRKQTRVPQTGVGQLGRRISKVANRPAEGPARADRTAESAQSPVARPALRQELEAEDVALLSSSYLVRASKGPGGGIFVAATPEQGIGRTLTDSVASMLSAHTIEIDELLETRKLLEVPLAGLAAQRATDEDIESLKEVLAAAAGHEHEPEHVLAVDTELHRRVAEIAGLRLAGAFMGWVGAVLQPLLHELVAPAVVDAVVVEQHRDVVRAIERGDPVAAERAMREHLVYLSDVVAAVRRSGER